MDGGSGAGALLGRVFLSQIFLISAFSKVLNFAGTAEHMAGRGIPAAKLLLAGAILFEVAGSLSILVGYRCRFGAFLLILFLIPTTLIFHNFWAVAPADQRMQMIHFMKNLAIIGGLIVLAAAGPGKISVDGSGQDDL